MGQEAVAPWLPEDWGRAEQGVFELLLEDCLA